MEQELKIFNVLGNNRNLNYSFELGMGVLNTYADGEKSLIRRHEKYPKMYTLDNFLDSGAFTFSKRPYELGGNVDKYIDFINSENSKPYEIICQLDAAGYFRSKLLSAEKTFENYVYMIDKIKHVDKFAVVFHGGENYKFLKQLLDYTSPSGKRASYLCLTRYNGASVGDLLSLFSDCFDIIHKSKNKDIKVHLLGINRFDLLESFPIYSCDSSTAVKMAIYGQVLYFDFKRRHWAFTFVGRLANELQARSFIAMPRLERENFKAYIKNFGFELEPLQNSDDERLKFNLRVIKQFTLEYKCNYKRRFNKLLF